MKKVNPFTVMSSLKKVFASGIIMAIGSVVFMLLGVNVLVNIVLCVCIYFAMLRVLREPLLIEIKHIISA